MKKFYALLLAISLTSFGVQGQTLGVDTFTLGEDDSDNYGGSWGNTNQGSGFSDWTFDNATPNGGFSGRFIASFSSALDVNGNSWGMFANSGNGAVSGASTTFPKAMEEGDSFSVSIGVNFRDGAKGFDLRNSSNSTIINFNVGNDQYRFNASQDLYGNAYDANTVITFTFTQNASDVSWTAVRSGGLSGSESGTVASISPGTINNIRLYNVSAGTNNDGGSGQRNLFVNSLGFESLYTIGESSTVNVSSDITVPYLGVESGSTLNVTAGTSLNVSGNLSNSGSLNISSTSSSYGNLIVNGTSSGNITYNRYVNATGNGNDLVAPPVDGQSWSDFLTDNATPLLDNGGTSPTIYAFGPFNKSTGNYENYDDTTSATLSAGTGYRAATDTGETLAFTGAVRTDNVDVDIQNFGPQEAEWNLVGNPYTSHLNVQDFLNHEVAAGVKNLNLFDAGTAGIYGYDGDATNGWIIYNLATTTASTVITPGQGFFVSADDANENLYDMQFTPAMRSDNNDDDFIAGRQGGLVYMTVLLESASDNYTTQVFFNEFATLGFDLGFDAEFFGSAPPFSIYTLLVEEDMGEPISLQAIGMDDLANTTIPLGVNIPAGVQVTISLSENFLPPSTEVFLEDTQEGTVTLLNTTDYIFTPTVQLFGAGRFFLGINDDTLSDIESTPEDSFSILSLKGKKTVVVNGQLSSDNQMDLYDIQGRLVLSQTLDHTASQNRIDVSNLGTGVYVINVQSGPQTKSQKVIIN